MSAIRSNPTVKRVRRRIEIVRRTHRWRPNSIRLAASGNLIHVDPTDSRGWGIVRGLGRGHQPALIDLWRRSIEALDATLAIDVGANYGEMVLSGSYPVGCRVLAVEPNPSVAALLRRSLDVHPDRARIELHECLASDGDEPTATLHIDPSWSGSASVALDGDGVVGIEVPVKTVDQLVGTPPDHTRLLVKIDAEGWEQQVVASMVETLDRADALVMIIEFDPHHLRRSGTDPDALYLRLGSLGSCWSVARSGALTPSTLTPVEATDLLVVSDPAVATRLGAPAA